MNNVLTPKRSSISLWLQAIRPFSLTASFIPIILGAVITLHYFEGPIEWNLIFLILIGGPFFQLAGNLFSEYFDFKNQVDRIETYGSSRILVEGLMKPHQILIGALVAVILLLLIGSILTLSRGLNMLILGVIGIIGAYSYTKLKYKALGDLHIFLSFGPLMVLGTIYALTGSWELFKQVIILSIPIGFLVTAILHANNTRDIKHDTEANITTFASLIGIKKSIFYYNLLIIGSYISIIILIATNQITYWSLLVFITLPIAIKNIKIMKFAKVEQPENIAMLDVMTAQLHMLFGLCLCISIIIGYFLK